jgi:hypothetical protein
MEQSILAALAARAGGDPVHRRNRRDGKLFQLATGIHDMRTVARELAEQHGHIDAGWLRRFYGAWRSLCDSGALEVPSLIPVAEVFPACQQRVYKVGDGTYLNGGRNRLYVSLTGKPAPPPRPVSVCRECGVGLPTKHRLRKWCAGCKTKLFRSRNVQAAAERKKQRRTRLADTKCERCGTKFTAARSNQVYCSSTCKQGVYRERKAALGLAATRKERSS